MRIAAPGLILALLACPCHEAAAQISPGIATEAARLGGLNEKQEIQIGALFAGSLLGAAPLVQDANLQRYVNRVGRWIASQSERPDLPWHFGVIETASINAFAAPGGFVLVTRALYELLENESQLAGVLAHEIVHIVRRHHIIGMQKKAGLNIFAQIIAGQTRNQFTQALIGTGAEIFHRGLDKADEFEADRMGVTLAIRAGYSPAGLIEVLHKLGARAGDDGALTYLFKTHPHPDERLQQLGIALTPHVEKFPEGVTPRLIAIGEQPPPPPVVAVPEPPRPYVAPQPAAKKPPAKKPVVRNKE